MNCYYCKTACIKKGKQNNGVQKYYCKVCKKHQQEGYVKNAYRFGTDKMIVKLSCNGSGIKDISRVLEISPKTVVQRIKKLAGLIAIPSTYIKGNTYEVDELKT